jgi:hypothetical protein
MVLELMFTSLIKDSTTHYILSNAPYISCVECHRASQAVSEATIVKIIIVKSLSVKIHVLFAVGARKQRLPQSCSLLHALS